mmetsp:Transcript_52757/g.140790  ORF Transcript_52757/g.140790 Transcript_52757/m.140790 type:complete len:102 (-) Transcript_52757:2597-2902(-)
MMAKTFHGNILHPLGDVLLIGQDEACPLTELLVPGSHHASCSLSVSMLSLDIASRDRNMPTGPHATQSWKTPRFQAVSGSTLEVEATSSPSELCGVTSSSG